MNDISNHERSVELLQQLGLKEYEAKAFVALERLPRGTAKEVSDVSDVPRTRVYDAIRVLESKGLVEVQHSSPQQFRAVAIDEAVQTLRQEYEGRIESLRTALEGLDAAPLESESEVASEVWSLTGAAAITTRTKRLVEDATDEVVLVLGSDRAYSEDVAEALRAACERGVDVVVGTTSEAVRREVERDVPAAEVFVSGLEGLVAPSGDDEDTEISRLLLVDRGNILVATLSTEAEERAVFGRGFENGLVVLARRLMATGLVPTADPGTTGD